MSGEVLRPMGIPPLGKASRRTLAALAETILPNKPGAPPVDLEAIVDFIDSFVPYMPKQLAFAFPIGIRGFDLGAIAFANHRPFWKMEKSARMAYVKLWSESRIRLQREMMRGLKGLCLFGYYSTPKVNDYIGYEPEKHVELVSAERLKRYGNDI